MVLYKTDSSFAMLVFFEWGRNDKLPAFLSFSLHSTKSRTKERHQNHIIEWDTVNNSCLK